MIGIGALRKEYASISRIPLSNISIGRWLNDNGFYIAQIAMPIRLRKGTARDVIDAVCAIAGKADVSDGGSTVFAVEPECGSEVISMTYPTPWCQSGRGRVSGI